MQRHWRSNRMRCIKNILGDVKDTKQPPRAAMEPYWTTVFTQPATVTMPESTQQPVQDSITSPIKAEEIRAARPSLAVSPGPDGLTARQFQAIPLGIIVLIFNLILWYENLPKHLAISRTIFIPKKSQASLPGEFRPFSISSVFARILHKILAQRIAQRSRWMISREPFEPGWMAAATRCYSTPSCGAGINNSSPLSPQIWTS